MYLNHLDESYTIVRQNLSYENLQILDRYNRCVVAVWSVCVLPILVQLHTYWVTLAVEKMSSAMVFLSYPEISKFFFNFSR
jgi:hypothetical protein